MKKIIGAILAFVCVSAIFIGGAQKPNGGCDLSWTIPCIAIALIAGALWSRYFKVKVTHIEDDIYNDLNTQIKSFAESMKVPHEITVFECDGVCIKVDISQKSSAIKFRDDAWGNVKTFTEKNWECSIKILDIKVYDFEGREVKVHDFDEAFIETEYESSSWE